MTIQQTPPVTLTRLAARFVSGRCMDGMRRTDATFLRHGSRDLTAYGRAPRYAWLPGWRRALVRMVTVASVSGAVWAWFFARSALITGALSVCAITGVIVSIRVYRLAIMWSHRRKVIYPLWHQR